MPTTPPNWDALKGIVTDALELPAGQREAFLVERCRGDDSLLREARELVASYEASEGVIDHRADEWLGLGGPDLLSLGGQRIGRYVLRRLLAEGAMAAVYEAQQENPRRTVALKLLRVALPMIDAAGRFRRESQALGRLVHPNIARIYEAGVHRSSGRAVIPFIAMEYVVGQPLTEYARSRHLDRRARIELLVKVALAVHAAHQQAVIHRDLKPANILVDQSGEPKVLDFGIAHIAGADDPQLTWQTTTGLLMGTPAYMSPEQASGRAEAVDVRSDVWALGVLLHELLTDRLPLDLRDSSIGQALKKIETTDPPPISRIDPSLRGDLEIVTMTALARDKQRRYPSAEAFAADLQRVLDYQPITARLPSRWYRLRRFARRHRVSLSLSLSIALLLAASSVLLSLALLRASRERDKAQAVNRFLQQMIMSADPSIGARDMTVLAALEASEKTITQTFGTNPLLEAEVRSNLGWTYFNLSQLERARSQIEHAIELRTAHGSPADPDCIRDQVRLITVLRWQYRPKEALELAERTYDLARSRLGASHPATVAVLEPLAGARLDLGDFDAAEKGYLEAVELNRRIHGPSHEHTLTAMNNLGDLYLQRSRFAAAEAIFAEVAAERMRSGPEKLPALSARQNHAVALSELGRFAEAEASLRQIAADAEEHLGSHHETTLDVLSNLATVLQRLGRVEEAITIQKTALDRRIAGYGTSHEPTLRDYADFASLLGQAGRWVEAIAAAEEGVKLARASRGEDHPVVLRNCHALAIALAGTGRHKEAEAAYGEVIEGYSRLFGEENCRTMIARTNLAACLIDQGRPDEALTILHSVLACAQQQRIDFMQASLQRHLGRAYAAAGQDRAAEQAWLEGYRLAETRGERENVRLIGSEMVKLLQRQGRTAELEQWRGRTR
ncbi:MAG: serine/threonine-protein kinase [Phycisphaerales bacterium]|nr:serine/threonine-protein kinase [Phycisphaerales bacterium]